MNTKGININDFLNVFCEELKDTKYLNHNSLNNLWFNKKIKKYQIKSPHLTFLKLDRKTKEVFDMNHIYELFDKNTNFGLSLAEKIDLRRLDKYHTVDWECFFN